MEYQKYIDDLKALLKKDQPWLEYDEMSFAAISLNEAMKHYSDKTAAGLNIVVQNLNSVSYYSLRELVRISTIVMQLKLFPIKYVPDIIKQMDEEEEPYFMAMVRHLSDLGLIKEMAPLLQAAAELNEAGKIHRKWLGSESKTLPFTMEYLLEIYTRFERAELECMKYFEKEFYMSAAEKFIGNW